MIHAALQHWASWIAATRPSLYLQRQKWAIVGSQSIHLVCVGVVFGSALLISLRLLGLGSSGRKVSQLLNTLVPWIYWALAVLFVTGVEQTIAEPFRQFMATVFWWKMALVAATLVLTISFTHVVRLRAAAWDDAATRPAGARLFAVVWLGLWIAIVGCGRFIGYA